RLPVFLPEDDAALQKAHEEIAAHDPFWRKTLAGARPAQLMLAKRADGKPDWQTLPLPLPDHALEAALIWARLSCGPDQPGDLAVASTSLLKAHQAAPGYFADWSPMTLPDVATKAQHFDAVTAEMTQRATRATFARDLILRDPDLGALDTPHLAIAAGAEPVQGSVICATPDTGHIHYDATRIDAAMAQILAQRLAHIAEWLEQAENDTALADCPALPPSERALLTSWNQTATPYDQSLTIPAAFDQQAAKSPDATAIVFEDQQITYADLGQRVDAIAHALIAQGIEQGAHVGLYTRRSIDMVAAALGIMKAGAAYIPLDPDYPADRIAHYIADSGTRLIVTQKGLAATLPTHDAQLLVLDDVTPAPEPVQTRADALGTAYLIYTSGSTGVPKGVMVTHRNVVNFFTGMDAEIDQTLGQTWAAVTSMAFDISVLELFYTLARGFKVVLMGDQNRAAVSNGPIRLPGRKIDFNLFYWGNDDGVGRDKYALLLEGAKFADTHGFNAVWTPERHFHAFGGPYPNPSVTGAAVAAVTRNLSVRAGSCVAPLHHTARIAEEWSVIDNLTNGRAGLAIASGWQPDDFVLRPENTPPENKPAMYRAIEDLRKLWRGEPVGFAKADGSLHDVVTQPRPVSKELPIWVTTAGNPDTWREAGEIGANVLTHLLGQSVDEVGEKIAIYHDALRKAGHDPDDFTVTLMLHTYLAADRDTARDVARGPMKDYLRSAAGLIKQYAWAFPAFKKPKGVTNPFQMDLGSLSEDELEAILDFAFERYFEDSGLFGTVDDALARVEQVKRIGVTEIACLIDYGIPVAQVMDGLRPLAQVLKAANAPAELAPDDFSLAAQIIRHDVSHLQCTPSMAQIIAMNDEARLALSRVRQLLIGGEALPGALVTDLRKATRARITNMYGPTETTIWSTMMPVPDAPGSTVPIGRPIANTSLHVLDASGREAPVGVAGELCIGGDGVTPGYWQRPEMTADRFVDLGDAHVYRTGDLVCLRGDGVPEFLGRNDTQVKIRGQRIELGEIEAAMTEMNFISQAVVTDRKTQSGAVALAAYYTAQGPVDEAALRAHLTAHLPDAMVPASFTRMDAFPLTPNRKIDRKALPDPQAPALPADPPRPVIVSDTRNTGQQIAQIWRNILGVQTIGPDDNFFALGGHSLLAVQAHRDIKAALGRSDISITDIFRFPTLAGLTRHLDGSNTSPQAPVEPASGQTRSDVILKRKAMRANRRAKVG
ncbi:MupA/Atu3671 family FMN-dependent luciferase-like monooxygenase, partial [Aestuariivita boseongensis]|uniref:MupA/Atu3671 family FMN-dependent luciferase-like monooxygenase n=1 Tax=Aestuariivita boseongensis TaxID=1470562 RepID=UPI000680A8A3